MVPARDENALIVIMLIRISHLSIAHEISRILKDNP